MAITDAEKQEIIDGLLEEIRANGLDYSGQTITFDDPFNITQTERQNVKIPAIDERKSTVIHGNVNLEALLTAYGVTHVEEIASDISSKYMEKVADSDLDMNGYDISNISQLVSNPSSSSRISSITPYPTYTYGELGFTSQPDIKELTLAYIKKIATDTTKEIRNGFFVTTIPSPYCLLICDIRWPSSNVNEEGIPHSCSGSVIPMQSKGVSYKFQISNYVYDFYQDSMFPYGDTTRDNRINAKGSNYIRYENGLQICWDSQSIEMPATTAWGSIYTSLWTGDMNYPLEFIETPSVSFSHIGTGTSFAPVKSAIYKAKITSITMIRGTGTSSPSPITISYVAIGKWK